MGLFDFLHRPSGEKYTGSNKRSRKNTNNDVNL